MVLESTMICFDNSDYQRNGDYFPTRLNVQKDAIDLVCLTKLRSNPENNVGLISYASSVEVLSTLTSDVSRIFAKMHLIQPKGEINLITGIRIAHLVLKHRQGKNHKMRIVVFVGSPVKDNEDDLIKLAKRLKKEKVNIDVVSFGDHDNNNNVLQIFVNTLNGKDGSASHLVSVPRGSGLSDALLTSAIIQGEDGMGGNGLGGAGYEFGVDPNEDPELALALRVSMEEQRQRQEAEQRRALANSNTNDGAPSDERNTGGDEKTSKTTAVKTTERAANISNTDNTEEAMLQRALAMSTEQNDDFPDFTNMTEEEQIAFAMQMSMQDATDVVMQKAKRPKTENQAPMDIDEDYSEVIGDPTFLQRVLENLPGVDPESDVVRNAVDSLKRDDDKDKNKDTEKK